MKEQAHALTVDLEFWWSNEFLTPYLPETRPDQVVEATEPLLDVLARNGKRATFFVLGATAERHPDLIRRIHSEGHEIASHGWSHKMLHDLTPAEFEQEIADSVVLLRRLTGERPVGFRAPCFSLDNRTRWALPILAKHGFAYDSSIFPIWTMLYGEPEAPVGIYKPALNDVTVHDPSGPLIELPLTVVDFPRLGRNFPIAGGFYLRALPYPVLRFAFGRTARKRPSVLYIHPAETYAGTPRLKVPWKDRLISYYGAGPRALAKFDRMVGAFNFRPAREVLGVSPVKEVVLA